MTAAPAACVRGPGAATGLRTSGVSTAAVLVLLAAALLSACVRAGDATAIEPLPPRSYIEGGAWFPESAGYWLHQYAERDELVESMGGAGFSCLPVPGTGNRTGHEHLRCERSFRFAGGLLSRWDSLEFTVRGNGSPESAEAGCRFALFDSPKLSGRCKRFVAAGAVYPDVETFARVVHAMLRRTGAAQRVDINRFEPTPPAPLRDADDAVERLTRWRFDCEFPKQRYRSDFRGKRHEVGELLCQHYSLRRPGKPPQSQQVFVYYDRVDLAVLGVQVRLGERTAMLPQEIATRAIDRADAAQPRLRLHALSGESFEVLLAEVGTGSHQATREGLESLTPASQRDLLQAYLDGLERQWGTAPARLSHLNPAALEWYGPQARPHLQALLADDRPVLGAVLLKHLCADEAAASGAPPGQAMFARAMQSCLDRLRAGMPASIAMLDRLLAQDLLQLQSSSDTALNAFADFRRELVYVIALGADARRAGAALRAIVANRSGLAADLQRLIAEALEVSEATSSPQAASTTDARGGAAPKPAHRGSRRRDLRRAKRLARLQHLRHAAGDQGRTVGLPAARRPNTVRRALRHRPVDDQLARQRLRRRRPDRSSGP
jgi:hypothetical protein